MKKILIIIPVLFLLVLSGCLKDKPNVDFSGLQQIAEISTASTNSTPNAPASGKAYFGAATLFFSTAPDPDTVTFTVNIASPNPPTKDIAITLAIDPAAIAGFNADTTINTSRVQYAVFPDSTFSFPVVTGTVKAGQRLDTFYVIFYPGKIDPTQSYMLPITITDASGVTISGNLSTIYFHAIGNPIAGSYDQEWIRYNTLAQTGTPAFDEDLGATSFIPDNSKQIEVESGTGVVYILSFTNTAGVLSDFQVSFPKTGPGAPSDPSVCITITGGPTIITADPVAGKYEFNFTYNNATGSARNITDIL
jgi:hypothetical protein